MLRLPLAVGLVVFRLQTGIAEFVCRYGPIPEANRHRFLETQTTDRWLGVIDTKKGKHRTTKYSQFESVDLSQWGGHQGVAATATSTTTFLVPLATRLLDQR